VPITGTTSLGADNTTFTAPVIDQDYQVCTEVDNELHCIYVTVANVAPIAIGEAYTVPEDTQLAVSAPGVLDNDTDENEDTLTASWKPRRTVERWC